MSEQLINQEAFFKKYNIDKGDFDNTSLSWNDLNKIYQDHKSNISKLQPIANYVAETLQGVKEVHSLKVRIKSPEHLIEKIIRKKIESPENEINIENYKTKLTDLIGVRALHLFKEDWNNIHEFVTNTWELHETPTANVRKGDSEEYIEQFKEKGCDINYHKYGYRSVHYLLNSQPTKEIVITELQVRTIFEEGWSEIDHRIRYPYDLDNELIKAVSFIHNRLAGSADEIASFIQFLKKTLKLKEEEVETQNKTISELKQKIQNLEIGENQKKAIEKDIDSLSSKALTINPKLFDLILKNLSTSNTFSNVKVLTPKHPNSGKKDKE
jgi:putative GTP pyrophosphokinase